MYSIQKRLCPGIALFLSSIAAHAQNVATGAISGQITDQQGAAIPSAKVTLTETSTNSTSVTNTNEAGRYTFPTVPPGTYDLTVTKEGFALAKLVAQKVDVGMALTMNLAMQIGQATTIIEVEATAGAELQVMNATIGSTISGDSLQLLPNLGRDASTLAVLQVGVTAFGNTAGANQDQNSFQLDGGNNSSDMDGNQRTYTPSNGYTGTSSTGGSPSGVIPTPVESIEEFKIGTSNQTADFAGAAGSQVQMVTKRGTNTFHGAAYEHYFAANIGAANLWKNNHTPSYGLPYTPLPSTHRNRFGMAGGGPLTPSFWGGKTYIFANYEGYRFPQTTTFEKAVPSLLLRNGIIQIPNSAGVYQAYNLNPVPVTVSGVTYQPAICSNGSFCDPRGLGFNPIVQKIWNTMMPMPNDPQYIVSGASDGVNQQGYLANIRLPQSSDFFVVRLDHDFGSKWKFMSSYRYYRFTQLATTQIDIGGVLPGDTFGVPSSSAPRPQKPWYLVAGLTGAITPNLTNDFRVSYLRNYWEWSTVGGPPQIPGLGGALEMGGETAAVNALIPYNVDAQNTRSRFWDGQDWLIRDDLSLLRGNHLFQFGGTYQRNYDYHQRNDNGVGIDTSVVYQITNGTGINFPAAYEPANLPASQITNWANLYAQALGMVSQPQVMYTRSGANLNLNPLGTPGFDQSIIPAYNVYFSDTWRMKPTFTLTYGLAYTLQLPPYEINGKQVGLVDSAGNPIELADYLAQKEKAALAGQVYDPIVGFATVRNTGGGQKYPFNTFYGGFSPRVSAAWSPKADNGVLGDILGHDKTVIRGGYGRIYGRLNGVGLVLVPLLGTGLLQPISCIGASRSGQCLGNGGVDPTTAFRIGADGMSAPLPAISQTLPQPYFPGVGGNASAGDGSQLDPHFKPSHSDEFNFTVQRALSQKLVIEAGYIGRRMRDEFQEINIDAVPYMTTLDGQSFANAYANLYQQLSSGSTAVSAQPFFEAALGGTGSAYCAKFGTCTAAVAANFKSSILATQVYSLWNGLNAAPSWTLGRTLLSSPAQAGGAVGTQLSSLEYYTNFGYGNYNGAFLSFTAKDWHGLTARSNFTWSRALGTGSLQQSSSSITVVDPWNVHASYGTQPFDIRFVYSLMMVYQPQFWKGQKGWGRALGGWSISPLFMAQSGAPLQVNVGTGSNSDAQAFGEIYGNNNRAFENAVLTGPFTGGNSTHYNVTASGAGVNGNASKGGSGINLFADPNATYALFRRPILGYDTSGGGAGVIRGLPSWTLDTSISKDIVLNERFGATLLFQITNILNHFQPANPTLNIDSPQTWGVITDQSTVGALSGIGGTAGGVPAINPRQMEFGLRLRF
ncbi:MAG: carboxypeptidase regulatory-like domain-containing protein [Bryobacterales bacterium]|nr:carboxypeptidase regulatory-like domain-containing protein [Bryobacterales bacterium]MBV9397541.1 carboxypeptidase regulatory-like domain-containing protein [Bryobacterales bacterium]